MISANIGALCRIRSISANLSTRPNYEIDFIVYQQNASKNSTIQFGQNNIDLPLKTER